MTIGIFNILIVFLYFTSAHKVGNRLILAVNINESLKRLKIENIKNNLNQRVYFLLFIELVNYIISLDKEDLSKLISNIYLDIFLNKIVY